MPSSINEIMAASHIRVSGLVLLVQCAAGFHHGMPGVAPLGRGSLWITSRCAEPASLVSSASSSNDESGEDAVYEQPELYDLAFSYRDFDAEVNG
jgi:hypothetical protein